MKDHPRRMDNGPGRPWPTTRIIGQPGEIPPPERKVSPLEAVLAMLLLLCLPALVFIAYKIAFTL